MREQGYFFHKYLQVEETNLIVVYSDFEETLRMIEKEMGNTNGTQLVQRGKYKK